MITKHDIKPGFRFSTANYDYSVVKITSRNRVYIRDFNSDNPKSSFKWTDIHTAVDILNTNSGFKVYKQPKLRYIEEL